MYKKRRGEMGFLSADGGTKEATWAVAIIGRESVCFVCVNEERRHIHGDRE